VSQAVSIPASGSESLRKITDSDLRGNAELRYGNLESVGPMIRRRLAYNYYAPIEHYETLIAQLVTARTNWLDVGCGRHLFPGNTSLARVLAHRCNLLVGLDPDETINDNPFVHQKVQGLLEDYRPNVPFDLVTLRMVAEHIADPHSVVRALSELCAPGGRVVVFTVSNGP
jgi:2-polyprenyl-3-methyl-5-hydroxy-6-metoxy-1,4-benzoquinol methylase